MDVILDSNIIIADPFLRSLRLRSLMDYVRKTRSKLVLLDPVEQEVRGHVQRAFRTAVEGIDSALRNAERIGVSGLPKLDSGSVLAACNEAWEKAFTNLPRHLVERVSLQPSILPEVVRRAAQRLAPVRSNGRETRDAIVWLSVIQYLRERKFVGSAAFVSSNTTDFAGSDAKTLRADLAPDLEGVKGTFNYFPSVEEFLKVYAEPISHVTEEWVRKRLDLNAVAALITSHLENTFAPENYFRVSSSEYRDHYEPAAVEVVHDPDVRLDDIYVWEVREEAIDVFLEFHAYAEADVRCRLIHPPVTRRAYNDDDEYRFERTLTCYAELGVSVGAQIQGDTLTLGDIEEIGSM